MNTFVRKSPFFLLILLALLPVPSFAERQHGTVLLGKWTQAELDAFLSTTSTISGVGKRIDRISRSLLSAAYQKSTLVGSRDVPERFVINLQGLDCFTYLDYVEAMRRSASFDEFIRNVRFVRYQGGDVRFEKRNHFFTDWEEFQSGHIENVTQQVGQHNIQTLTKQLNKRDEQRYYVHGIPARPRRISYIPSQFIDRAMLDRLQTGDYIGIYTHRQGIDVSHTGILIKNEDGKCLLRHASASKRHRKVLDEDFRRYIRRKAGIIVFRPLDREFQHTSRASNVRR